jgi:hypothetical protein
MLRRFSQLLASALLVFITACNGPESLESKNEYAALQSIEIEGRGALLGEPVVREINGFSILGITGQNGKNVWVLLHPLSEPYYKQMPSGLHYSVPEALIKQLEREGRVSPEVARWLRKGGV